MTAAALPYVIAGAATVGGSLLQNMAASRAADKQASIIEAAERRAQKQMQRNRDLTMEEAEKFDPEARKAEQGQVEQGIMASLTAALNSGGSAAENTNEGNVSQDFTTARARATADRQREGIDMARLMAKMRAPNQQRLDESLRLGDLSSRLQENASNAESYLRAGEADAAGVRPNALLQLIGGGLQAYGTAKALGTAQKAMTPTYTHPGGYSSAVPRGVKAFLQ